MTAVWIGVGVLGWFVVAFGAGVCIGRAIRSNPPQEPDAEPVWGCDGCQDEAEEIAALEAVWNVS